MLLGEYSVRTGKTPQQKHIHHKHTTLQQGKKSSSGKQPSGPAATIPALVTDPLVRLVVQSYGGEGSGGGGSAYLYICVYMCVCVCSSCNQQMSVEWGRKQERLTAVLFPGLFSSSSQQAGTGSQKR